MAAAKYLCWPNVRNGPYPKVFFDTRGTVVSPEGNEAELRRQFADHFTNPATPASGGGPYGGGGGTTSETSNAMNFTVNYESSVSRGLESPGRPSGCKLYIYEEGSVYRTSQTRRKARRDTLRSLKAKSL